MAIAQAPLGAVPGIISTNGVPGFPQLKTGTGCRTEGDVCLGEVFCTILGCACLGVCVAGGLPPPTNGGLPFNGGPGPGGPAPPIPPPGAPPPLAPPQAAPQVGTCPPRAGAVAGVICGPGCHPNKAEYCLKSGERVFKGTRCVRNRRRNPLNPRALDRAISRIGSAQNAVARLGFQKKAPRRRSRKPASVC